MFAFNSFPLCPPIEQLHFTAPRLPSTRPMEKREGGEDQVKGFFITFLKGTNSTALTLSPASASLPKIHPHPPLPLLLLQPSLPNPLPVPAPLDHLPLLRFIPAISLGNHQDFVVSPGEGGNNDSLEDSFHPIPWPPWGGLGCKSHPKGVISPQPARPSLSDKSRDNTAPNHRGPSEHLWAPQHHLKAANSSSLSEPGSEAWNYYGLKKWKFPALHLLFSLLGGFFLSGFFFSLLQIATKCQNNPVFI